MSEDAAVAAPSTGNTIVDRALSEVADLSEVGLGEHHDRLSAVQDVLTGVLESSRNAVQTPIPGVLRPNHQEQHG